MSQHGVAKAERRPAEQSEEKTERRLRPLVAHSGEMRHELRLFFSSRLLPRVK
jgi:hypothetical protein